MKKRKMLWMTVVMAMILQILAPFNYAIAEKPPISGDQIAVNNDHGKTYIKITDKAGKEITPASNPDGSLTYTDIPKDAKIEIQYEFELLSGPPEAPYNYEPGDYFVVPYPDVIKFNSLDGINVSGKDDDENDIKVGSLSLEGTSNIKITLSEDIEGLDGIHGWYKINGTFDETIIGNGGGTPVQFTFAGKIINIGFKVPDPEPPKDVNVTLAKSGEYIDASNEILWTIKVTPSTTASGISIVDEFSNNQKYVEGSFAVDGNAASVTITGGSGAANYKFEYVFPEEIPEGTTKIITYRTKPNVGLESSSNKNPAFNNNVKAFHNNKQKDDKSASVSLNWIEKSGTIGDGKVSGDGADSDIRKIKWTVTVNNDNKTISGAEIKDTIPKGLKLVEDSVKINGVPVSKGSALGEYTITGNSGESKTLIYKFNGTISTQQTLTYITELEDPNDALNSNTAPTYYNKAEFSWTEKGDGLSAPSDGDGVGIGKGVISKAAGGTEAFYPDGTADVITWTVKVNSNKIKITNAIVTDDIPKGLEYVDGSFDIDDKTGGNFNGQFVYTEADPNDSQKSGTIKYEFSKPSDSNRIINSTYTITFKTKVTADSYKKLFKNGSTSFPNNVTLKGEGLKDGKPITTGGGQEYTTEVINKSVDKGYDYDTRRTTWKIVVNKSQLPMTKATVTDTLPVGMKLVGSTFKVVDAGGNDVAATAGTRTDIIKGDDNITEADSFTYEFNGMIDEQFIITFDTEMKEEYLKQNKFDNAKEFKNDASLKTENYGNGPKVSASVWVKNPIIDKKASNIDKNDGYIDWQVPINHNKVHLGKVTVSDKLQAGLLLDTDSVKLYKMTWNPGNGNIVKGAPVSKALAASATEYSFEYNKNGDNLFRVDLPTDTEEAYVLEFTTYILQKPITVENTIKFSGTDLNSQDSQKVQFVTDLNSNSGGGAGSAKLTINKTDADTGESLSGATYKVYDAYMAQTSVTSVSGGSTVYDKLKYRAYFIEEITPPAGYLRDPEVKKIILTKDNKEKTLPFSNKKALGDIEFTKKDDSGKVLEGAGFTLYDSAGKPVGLEVKSDALGKVKFTGIPLGTYTIKETTVPDKHIKSADITAEVKYKDGSNMTSTYVVLGTDTAINTRAYGDIAFSKKANTTGTPNLQGAVFTLYDKNGAAVKTATSDSNGEVKFSKVDLGEYTIKETNAPAGYIRSSEVINAEVKLKDDKTGVEVILSSQEKKDFNAAAKTFTNEKVYRDISFAKKDIDGNKLQGATFNLYKQGDLNNVLKSVTTKADGVVRFEGLEVGDYVIKEIDPPTGYLLGSGTIHVTIALDADQRIVNVTPAEDVINQKALGKVEFTKRDGSGQLLQGAEFTLYDSTNKEIVKTATSDDKGIVQFTGVPLGKYFIKETKTPAGYYTMNKDANAKIDVEVKYNNDKTGVIVTDIADVTNEKAYGKIEFTKKTDSGQDLSGAEFKLYKKGDLTNSLDTVTTGSDGKVVFNNLEIGSYIIKETNAPAGYFRSPYEIAADISLDAEHTKLIQTLSDNKRDFDADKGIFINEKAYGNIEFIKKSDVDGEALKGAIFELYRNDGTRTLLQTVTSGSDGKVVFTHLEVGSYIIKEITSPDGYFLLNKDIEIEHKLNADQTKLEVTGLPEPFINTKALGKIEFEKQTDSGRPLGGAEFTIYKKGSTAEIKTVKSDNAGKVVFEGIEVGDYEIKETKAPSGFYRSNDIIEAKVELIKNNTELVVTVSKDVIKNTPIPGVAYGSIEIYKVDEGSKPLSGAKFSLLNINGVSVQSGVSGPDGKVRFNFVVAGDYTIREIEAPAGYVLESRDIKVKIDSTAVRTFTVVNKEEKKEIFGSITVVKTDGSGKKLKGAEFILFDKDGKELSKATTGSDGTVVFDKLPLGNYTVAESVAPEGYELSKEKITVTVNSEKTRTITVVNRKSDEPVTPGTPETPGTPGTPGTNVSGGKGSIIINKIDIASKPLAGAEFTLFDEKGNAIAKAISGKDGLVVFKDLEPGKYQVQETSAPEGYALVAEKLTVTIASVQQLKYNFRNVLEDELIDNEIPLGWIPVDNDKVPGGKPKPGGKLPQAGEMIDTFVMVAAGAVLVLLGSGQLIYRRRLKKNEK